MRSIAVLFVFALAVFTGSARGQEAGGGPSKPAVPVADYSAESAVVERLDVVYRYGADGTGTKELSAVIRIQSDVAARQQYGVLNFNFASESEHVEIEYIRVRKPDGSVVETPGSDAQEMPLEITRQAPFYSDLKEKQVPIRNLAVGDRLEYKARIIDTKAEIPGQFWGQESFGKWAVILNQTVELHVPKSKYVKVWSPEVSPAKTETGEEVVYRWTGSHLDPIVGKDGKAIPQEINPRGELPSIAWTTFRNWDEIGTWYRGLEADRIVPDATVKARAAEIIAGKSTDTEKAQALYSYVATQIRYVGVAFGIGRYQPHPAAEVLRNQYGDCKDKHTLLAAMLTAAGLHPEAVLIGAGIRLNEEVPSPAAFNHMITQVPIAGAPVWLDTTSELAPYQMLIQVLRDKQALVVPETGPAKLEKTPAELPFTPFTRFIAKGTLTKDGTMKAQIEYTTRGDDEVVMRTLLRQVPRGQWNELIQRLSQGFGFGGTTSNPDAGRPEATADPVNIRYDYEREKTGDWENRRILPLFPLIYLPTVDEKNPPKKVPIELGEPRIETSLSTIRLPDGWGATLPNEVHAKSAYATFDKTYRIEGETLTVERRIQVLTRRVPAEEWKAYKKWCDASFSDGEPFISLVPTAGDKGVDASKTSAASLVDEANLQIERGEMNAAQVTLDKAKALDEKQQNLWSTYGYMYFEQRSWDKAIEAYKKEIALYPDTAWVYRALISAQANNAHFEDAVETSRFLLKMKNVADDDLKPAVAMLTVTGHYEDTIPALEQFHAKSPEDDSIQMSLGIAQLESGHQEAGQKILVSVLDKTNDPGLLNNGAYFLAKEGVELELALKSAQRAVDSLTASSKEWTLDAAGKDSLRQQGQQALLNSAWDTLGWILYRQGNLDEAENYLRAAWQNRQGPEIGLHLGELEEKRGNKQEALRFYTLAANRKGVDIPKPAYAELLRHRDALKKQGISTTAAQEDLMKARILRVGSKAGKNAMQEYSFFIESGKITEISKSSAGEEIPGGDAMVRRADVTAWTPKGSTARLVFAGTLNCHSGVCELVIHPM